MNLKYPKELYVGSGFYSDMDCEYINETEKLVKCRKQHKCVNCQKLIDAGDYALQEKALFPGDGWKSAYTCTACIEEWLEESGQVESEEVWISKNCKSCNNYKDEYCSELDMKPCYPEECCDYFVGRTN